jgi:hypothetical protein
MDLFAQVAAASFDPWIDLVTRLGLPVALLVAVLRYHAGVVKEKDAELARINDKWSDRLLERDKEFTKLMGDVEVTLGSLLEKIK